MFIPRESLGTMLPSPWLPKELSPFRVRVVWPEPLDGRMTATKPARIKDKETFIMRSDVGVGSFEIGLFDTAPFVQKGG